MAKSLEQLNSERITKLEKTCLAVAQNLRYWSLQLMQEEDIGKIAKYLINEAWFLEQRSKGE